MIVFGARAGRFAAESSEGIRISPEVPKVQIKQAIDCISSLARPASGRILAGEVRKKVRALMGKHAHMVRDEEGLKRALAELQTVRKDLDLLGADIQAGLRFNQNLIDCIDVRWGVDCAQAVCHAALTRTESRGFHFRSDFPEEKKEWLKHTVVKWKHTGGWECADKPISR
jgi:succinate dehydrogenase/fumarate reductase flavoprotein subunit